MLNFLYVLLLKDVKYIHIHIFIALYKCHILLTIFQIKLYKFKGIQTFKGEYTNKKESISTSWGNETT